MDSITIAILTRPFQALLSRDLDVSDWMTAALLAALVLYLAFLWRLELEETAAPLSLGVGPRGLVVREPGASRPATRERPGDAKPQGKEQRRAA